MFATIESDEIGIVFRNGIYEKFLRPGRHWIMRWGQIVVERHKVVNEFKSAKGLEIFLQDNALMKLVDVIDVGDKQVALHYADDHFQKIIKPGKTAFFNILRKNRFELIDFSNPEIPETVSASVLAHAELTPYLQVVNLTSFEKAMLFFNGKFMRLLEPGKYYFWNGPTKVTAQSFDMRQQQLDMTGQEIMTQDKVTLRLNFICQYRIVDPVALFQKIKEYEKQLYILLQLILREYVGMLRLDELLEKKEEIGQFILGKLKQPAGSRR